MLCNASPRPPSPFCLPLHSESLHYWALWFRAENKGEVVVVVVVGEQRVVWKDSGKRGDDLLFFVLLKPVVRFSKTVQLFAKSWLRIVMLPQQSTRMTLSYFKIKPGRMKGARLCLLWGHGAGCIVMMCVRRIGFAIEYTGPFCIIYAGV